uniref:Uncharacterized protein n=1 Tax=Amphilophus citrinellus TaxID=61819 RepID=A0A3Q0QU21_AMPCI
QGWVARDVICNYHGILISEAEEKQRPQSGYLFFFKGERARGMCIDASGFPCAFGQSTEHHENQGNHPGLQEAQNRPEPPVDQWRACGEVPHLQVSRSHSSHQEDSAMTTFPEGPRAELTDSRTVSLPKQRPL